MLIKCLFFELDAMQIWNQQGISNPPCTIGETQYMYDVSFALILASRSRRNLVVREFSIGRCPSVLPKFFSINFIAKNRKCYPSRAYSLKFNPLLIVNIFCYSDILVQLKDIQKNFHGISKSAPFFLIRSRKKELKTLSKPTTFFNIPTLMKH